MVINNWKAPSRGFVKVNWDTSVDKINRKMGICVIGRDLMREVLAMSIAPKYNITYPVITVFIAILRTTISVES